MHVQTLTGRWQFHEAGADEWLPAAVPGSVYTDLLALGRIPDPFVGDNEKTLAGVAENDWVYRHTFTPDESLLSEEHIVLVCDGLDTLAEVTLNGKAIGATDNMFLQYRWDVTGLLQPGENELVIRFASPVGYVVERNKERPLTSVNQPTPGAPHIRKAPYMFGWDWGPTLPSIGIWKDIRLEGHSTARLDDVHLRQSHEDNAVTVSAAVRVEDWGGQPLRVALSVAAPDGKEQNAQAEVKNGEATVQVVITVPALWWPNGYGDQPLYRVKVSLLADGALCDSRAYQIGLRTIALQQETDKWGTTFRFIVNGIPIFAKGANWIPSDTFPARPSDAHLEHLIGSAAASHQNMLRVWGGGFYEDERFYDLCDRYGLLVWQEFIFACSIYPLDDLSFLENLAGEVRDNVRRLRHRACLALWCGNNEMEWGWESWGWAPFDLSAEEAILVGSLVQRLPFIQQFLSSLQPAAPPLSDWSLLRDAYQQFFHTTLPEWVAALDPDTPYWPSSPSSNTPFRDVNAESQGDMHYWGVWHQREPFTAYRKLFPRFMSEFGFQSLPPMETVAAFADEADWNLTSYIMEYHQRGNQGNGLMLSQMTSTYRMPKNFPSLVYLTMVQQAEGIRMGVEHWRRHMNRVYGTLYWQLNDCWPAASWSGIDCYGRWKALHYAAKRFYAPVLLSIEDEGTKMGIHVSSDLPKPWEGTVRWSLETLSGEMLVKGEEAISAASLTSTHVGTLDFADRVSEANQRDVVFVCELWHEDERVALTVTPFIPSKHLNLTEPELKTDIRLEDGKAHITVRGASLARFVELKVAGVDVVFDDNYVDLPAARTMAFTCDVPNGYDVDRLREGLRLRSLYDSFESLPGSHSSTMVSNSM
jgi:beta-mannosidase